MANYTGGGLYLWNKTDPKLTTIEETAKSTQKINDSLADIAINAIKGYQQLKVGVDWTNAINQAIQDAQKGQRVIVPYGDYNVTTINLKSDIELIVFGKLIQTTLPNLETFSDSNQDSNTPLIKGDGLSNIKLNINGKSNYEAISLLNCTGVTITGGNMEGDNVNGTFAGIFLYTCNDIKIRHNEVFHFGKPRNSTSVYTDGTGIRLIGCTNVKIEDNKIHDNGQNGVFTWGCKKIYIDGNEIINNGMSGVQIAFNGTGTEKFYTISNNTIEGNTADAIDINNDAFSLIDLQCKIFNNKSDNNGFYNAQSTPDGSGIATLIKVDNVYIWGNKATNSNKGAFYIKDCGSIDIQRNESDNIIEVVGTFTNLTFGRNIFTYFNVLAGTNGKKLHITGDNQFGNLSLPDSITIEELLVENNTLTDTHINLTLTKGKVKFLKNTLSSVISTATSKSIFFVTSLDKLEIIGNDIINNVSGSHGIEINSVLDNKVMIKRNDITSYNIGIADIGSKNILLEDNRITSISGGSSVTRTIRLNNPNKAKLIRNTHYGLVTDNSLRLDGTGTAFLWYDENISGTRDLGTTTTKIDGV